MKGLHEVLDLITLTSVSSVVKNKLRSQIRQNCDVNASTFE